MPVINKSESERLARRVNRILYADFLTQQNDYANGAATAPPVLKSRYELYNQLAIGRLETTPTEQVARLVVAIPSPPVLSASSIRPSATDTSVTLNLPMSSAVTSYTYIVSNSAGVPLVPQPTVTGDAATTGQVTFSPLVPGTQYSVVITSTGPSGTTVSSPLPIYTLPTNPSGFSASAPTTGGGTISWSGGGGATEYDYIVTDSTNNQVYPSTSGSSPVGIVDNGISGSATFTGLDSGSRYTITVIPRNPSGIPSSPPSTFSIDTAPAAPPAPTSSGSTTDGFSIPLTSSIGATGTPPYIYIVDGNPVTTTSSPVSYAVIGNDVVFTGVTTGSHTVRVTSVSAAGVQSPGAVATVYTTPVAPLSNTFSVTSTSPSAFTLSWSGTTGATSYSYTIKANGVLIANPTIVDNGAAGNAVFSNLSPGVTYSVAVTVINLASPPNSATSSAVTAFTAPNAAAGITQTAGTETSVTIAWTDAAGATTFLYDVKDVATQSSVGTGVTASSLLGATISGLTAGKSYSVIVTARNANGSTLSTAATVYTAPSKPTGLYQPSSTTTSITMAWYNGVGATSYVYTLGANTAIPSSDFGVTSQTAIFTGLTPGQSYTPITVTAQRIVSPSLTLSTASDNYTTAGTSPAAPSFPASPVSGLTSTGFTVSWNAGSGAGAYTYSLSVPAGPNLLGAAPGPRVASSTANSVTFAGLTPGTQYYPSITAAISGVPGTSSSSPPAVTTDSAPAAPTATNTPSNTITSRGVTIGFTPLAGMTYCCNVDGAATALITSLTPPATTPSYFLTPNPLVAGQPATVQFTGMSSGAAHTVSIFSTDAGGTSSPSPYTFTFNTQPAPAAPTATAAATFTQTAITLTLPTPPTGTTYSYSVSGGSPIAVLSPQPVPTISGSTYTFAGLTAGTAYTVAVTATDSAGSTSVYTSPSITTASPPPVPPTAAATPLTTVTSKGFTVNWNAVSGATSYTYSINTGGSSAQGPSQSTTSTNAVFTGLTPGTTYTVKVFSVRAGVQSTTSVDYTPATLAGPTAITATTSAITATGFTVSWTGGTSSVSGNTITYSTVATPTTGTAVTKTGASPLGFTLLTSGMTYNIVVTATDSAGTTSTSSSINVTTTLNIPLAPTPVIGTVTTTSISVSWNIIAGATAYSYILYAADGTTVVQQGSTTTTGVNILSGLSGSFVYNFAVNSLVGGVTSPNSSLVPIVTLRLNDMTGVSNMFPGPNPTITSYGNYKINSIRVGLSPYIIYVSITLLAGNNSDVGYAISSYDITTRSFTKILQIPDTSGGTSGLEYYNNKLYYFTNNTFTKVATLRYIDLLETPKIPRGSITVPALCYNINKDGSGNLIFMSNPTTIGSPHSIYKVSIPANGVPTTRGNPIYNIEGTSPQPRGNTMAIDKAGNIFYYSGNTLQRIRIFNNVYQGISQISIGNPSISSTTPLRANSDNSRIYIYVANTLRYIANDTSSLTSMPYTGFSPAGVDLAVNETNNIIYVADSGFLNALRIA